jgi:predicted outer membrane protein
MNTWSRRSVTRVIAILVVGGTVGGLAAQQQTQTRPPQAQPGAAQPGAAQPGTIRPGQPQTQAAGATAQDNDRRIAHWLNIGNKGQIELAKIAQERASNEKVKELADAMVEDHQNFGNELQKFMSGQTLTQTQGAQGQSQTGQPQRVTTAKPPLSADDAQPAARDPNVQQPNAQQTRPQIGAMAGRPVDFLAIKEQVCNEVLKDIKEELQELSGSDFDKAFVGMQVGFHHEMLATAKAVRGHVSRDFQAMLDEEIENCDAHLDKAKEICEELRGQKDSSAKDRSDTKRQPEKDGR